MNQDHTKRIDEIFTSLVKKVIDDNNHNSAVINKVRQEKQQEIDHLELESKKLQTELSKVNHMLSESQQLLEKIEESYNAQKENNRFLSLEIERLNNFSSSYNYTEHEQLSLELSQLRHQIEILVIKDQHNQEIIELLRKDKNYDDLRRK